MALLAECHIPILSSFTMHCSHAIDVHCSAQPSVIDRVFAELCGSLFYLSLSLSSYLLGQLVEYDVHPEILLWF